MVEKAVDDIVVLASDPSDADAIGELLASIDLRSGERRLAEAVAVPSPRRATILCHRASGENPFPLLPELFGGERVVVLSDCTAERAVVDALEAGAHHYFDIDESRPVLRARLAAALRSHSSSLRRQLLVAPFRFDPAKRLVWRERQPIGLSPKEFDLAFYLFSNRGRTVGNRELMTAVWSLPRTMDTRRIDTAACRVRKKMGLEHPDAGWYLRGLRGEGYVLVTDGRGAGDRRDPTRAVG